MTSDALILGTEATPLGRAGRCAPAAPAEPSGHRAQTSVADAFFTALAHASGDVDQDLPVLLQVVAESLGFEVATMWWWKAEEGVLRCEHVWQAPAANCTAFLELALRSALAPGEPVPGVVFGNGAPVWVPDVKSYPNFRRGPAASASGLRSGVAFPIQARGDIVGVFELFTLEQRDLDAPLLDEVAKAAAHLGDFIERLNVHAERDRLLGELHVAHRRQRFLLDANRALSTTKGLRETIDKLARVAVPAIGDLCLIDVVTKTGGIERLSAYHADRSLARVVDQLRRFPPLPDGDHPAAIAIRSGTSQIGYEMPRPFLASTTQSPHHYELTQQLHFTSYVSVPLHSDEQPVGALTVVSAGSGRHFGGEELHLVQELAAQVSSVMERERRFDEQHHLALVLQRSMLPELVEAPDGLDVSARYFASSQDTEIGGDFYDLVHLGASRVALVVGDVQGHDLTAITVMAKVRNALRAFFQTLYSLDEVLQAVDHFVTAQPEQRFVTLAIAVLDVTTGAVELALAGHPAPLQLGTTVEALACQPGPPLGTAHRLGQSGYQTARSHLPVGASLVFYTDGLIEARRGGPEARLPALLEAVDRHRHAPLEQACDAIIEDTLAGVTPPDDVAVLWAVRTGPETDGTKPDGP